MNSKPTPDTFPELPDVLVWYRFVLAVVFSLYLGYQEVLKTDPLTDSNEDSRFKRTTSSLSIILQALNLLAFLPFVYGKYYLGIEGEHFSAELLFAGLLNGMALFMLIWVIFFTQSHEDDVAAIAAFLANYSSSLANDSGETVINPSDAPEF